MPSEVFADMWSDLMAGRPWRGIIKNRRKDGGFYWVVANVSTVRKTGQVIGYQSIHGLPTPEEISAAQEAYLRLSAGDKSIYIKHGRIITCRPAWISVLLSLRVQMILTGLLILLPALAIVSNSLDGPSLSPDTALAVAALSLVYAVYYLWFYIPQTTRDLNNTAAWLESILRSGNLKQRFDVDRTDVIGGIARKADEFVASIQATIQGIGDLADQVSFATREVHSGVKTSHDSAPKQNQATSSTAAAIEQVTV
jgi:aerotaxis receptor